MRRTAEEACGGKSIIIMLVQIKTYIPPGFSDEEDLVRMLRLPNHNVGFIQLSKHTFYGNILMS